MQKRRQGRLGWGGGGMGALAMICAGLAAGGAQAAASPSEEESEVLARIAEQTRHLEALKRQLAEADARLAEIRRALAPEVLRSLRGGTAAPLAAQELQPAEVKTVEVAQESETPSPPPPQSPPPSPPVAAATPERSGDGRPPAVAPIFEQPGVLTPRGKFVVEPGLSYGYSSSNRISLVGYSIIPALHIGLIDIREVKRNTFTASLTGRWGVTNRFEVEAKVPYVYRSDSVISRPIGTGASQDSLFESTGSGIGDVEVTGRYQLNDGGGDMPYFIGTLRFKSRTGKDPFEVLSEVPAPGQASNELQKELPTGSGFYTLQPGLTMLYPADPAVFFGSVSYQHNFKRSNVSMNTTGGSQPLGEIAPGGVFGFNFGMGLALNDRSSFSIGYDHASIGKTKQNGADALNSVRTQLGTLLLGYTQRINSSTSLNVSVGAGVTRDTPDVTLSVRLPITF